MRSTYIAADIQHNNKLKSSNDYVLFRVCSELSIHFHDHDLVYMNGRKEVPVVSHGGTQTTIQGPE